MMRAQNWFCPEVSDATEKQISSRQTDLISQNTNPGLLCIFLVFFIQLFVFIFSRLFLEKLVAQLSLMVKAKIGNVNFLEIPI